MSRSVDERAVIMEFDNKQFESGIAQSRKSLEQFEKSLELKGASEAIDKIQKQLNGVDFSGMQRSLETISNRFSAMGIAGMTVIQNLTNEIVNFAKNGLVQILGKINEGGKKRALSLEKSRFLLQGILKDEERVADAMKQANDSVDGTAYSLDAAAKAASTFVATGLEGEKLRSALDAVANLTATVSGNYEDISSIITKVVGSHKLYRQELNQIVSRGFALDQYIAEYIENVNKGVWETTDAVRQNIKDMDLLGKKAVSVSDLTSGKNGQLKAISSDLVMEVLNKKLQGQAKRANETLTGIIDNIGAAWSRIGAMFYEPLVAQNSELVLFLQAVRLSINAIKKGLEPFAKVVTDITLKIFGGAKAIAEFTKDSDGVASAHKPLLELTKLFEAFFNIIKPGLLTFEKFIEITNDLFGDTIIRRINSAILTFSEWASRGSDSFEITEELEQKLKDLGIAFDKATQPLRDFWTMVKAAFYAVFDLSDTTSGIEGFIDNLTSLFNTIAEGNQLTDAQKGGIFSVAYNIFNFIKNTGTNVVKIIETLGGTLMFAFGELKKFISGFIDFVKPIGQAIKESGILQSILDLLSTTFGKIGESLSGVPGLIGGLFASFNGNADPLENFTNFLKAAKEWIDKLTDSLKNFKIGDGFKGFIDFVKNLFDTKEQLNELEESTSKSGKNGGAASLGVVGFGQQMKLTTEFVGMTKDAVNAAGGNSTFESVRKSIEKFVIPLLNEMPKLAAATIGLIALFKALDIIKEIRRFKQPLADLRDAWAEVGKAFSKSINKVAMASLIATISLLFGTMGALLLIIKNVVNGENPGWIFGAFVAMMGILVAIIIATGNVLNKIMKSINTQVKESIIKQIPIILLSISAVFVAISKVMVSLGKSLLLMATAMKIAGGPGEFAIMAAFLAAYLAMIIAIVDIIIHNFEIQIKQKKNIPNEKDLNRGYLGIAVIIASIGVAMLSIGKAMVFMATAMKIDKSIWWKSLIFFAAFGGFVIGLLFLAEKLNSVDSKALSGMAALVSSVGVVMLAFSASINIIIAAIAKIVGLIALGADVNKAIMVLGSICLLMITAIGFLAIIMSYMNKFTEGNFDYKILIAISVGLAAFAVAINMLILPLSTLCGLLAASAPVWQSIGALATMMAILVVPLGVIGVLSSKMPGFATGLVIFSGAMITLATAIFIFIAAINELVTVVAKWLLLQDAWAKTDPEKISDGMANSATAMAAGLEKSGPDIAKAIETLFAEGGIIDKIFDGITSSAERNVDKIANSFGKIVDRIYDVMEGKSDKLDFIAEKFGDFLNKAITNLTKGKDVGGLIGDILFGEGSDFDVRAEGLFGTIREIIIRIATFLPDTIWGVLQRIGQIIEENIDGIKQFIFNRIDDFDEIFERVAISLGRTIGNLATPLTTALFTILGRLVEETAKFFEVHHDDLLSILGALMLLPLEALSNFLVTNGDLILTTLGGITVIFLKWLGILFQELRKWWDEHWEPDVEPFLYTSFMDTLELAAKALRDSTVLITSTAVALGFDIIAGLLDGLQQGMPGIADEAVETIETFRDEICAPERIERVVDAAVGIIENFVNGITRWLNNDKNITDLRDAFVHLGWACIRAIMTFFGINTDGSASNSGPLGNLANNILNGIANGLLWAWDNSPLAAVINTVGGYIIDCFKAIFKIESPSKVAFGWGDYIDEGLALGISKNSNKVVRSVDEMSDDIKSSVVMMIEALKMAGDEEFDINPVITPVVDLSNVTDAANMTSRMFNGYNNAFSMSYNTASALSSGFAYNKPTSSDGTTSNSSIVNFTQNNYSPEPLSHYETYRQTKNLLRTIDSRI